MSNSNDLADFFADRNGRASAIDDDDVQIGARIREARLALSDSAADIAERVGVEVDTFEQWESGQLSLRANHLPRVAGVLGISVSWLIMGHGSEPTGSGSDIDRLRVDLATARSHLDDVVNELAVLDQRLADLDDA